MSLADPAANDHMSGPDPSTVAGVRRSFSAAHQQRLWWLRGLGLRLIHALLTAFSVLAASGLAVALSGEWPVFADFKTFLCVLIGAKMTTFELFRLHRASWRWFGLADAAAITVANTSGSVLGALLLGPRIATPAMPAILVVDWLLSQAALLGSRMLFRAVRERSAQPRSKRVLIYGAGRRGVNLMRRIRANPCSRFEIAGFLDDDPRKRHTMIQMQPVLGNGDELPRLARLHDVDEVLIAVGPGGCKSRVRFRELARMADVRCRFPSCRGKRTHRRTTAVAP